MPKDCDGAFAQDVTRRLQEQASGHPLQGHGVFHSTHRGNCQSSVVVCGRVGSQPGNAAPLGQQPQFVWPFAVESGSRLVQSGDRSHSRSRLRYEPSLGFYQAMGSAGLELLMEVRELLPPDLPLIIDSKHGDLNSASAMASYVFRLGYGSAVDC